MGGCAVSLMFACAMENEQGPERTHQTVFVMKRCPRCRKHAVAGYQCDEEGCGHEDVDAEDQMWGHGEGKCDPAATEDGAR
jgi:hypothetical protein